MITLRPYQERDLERLRQAMRRTRRVCYTAPTGSGKTVLFSAIAQGVTGKGKTALILVHRRELVRQTGTKLAAFEVPHGVLTADAKRDLGQPIVIAAVQTLARRLSAGLALEPDLIVIDEAHHATAATWRTILAAFSNAHILGVTATPARLDGKGLRDVFDELVLGPTVRELIEAGYLASSLTYARAGAEDALRSLRRVGGDYAQGQLERLMLDMGVTQAAVHDYVDLAQGQQGFAFCTTLRHAEAVALAFRQAGVPAASIDGSLGSTERDTLISGFAKGEIKLLASCELLSEGFDCPDASVAILLRPTLSLTIHRQQVGRVLRPKAEGGHALIVDHAGNTFAHGLPDEEIEWSLDGRQPQAPGQAPVKACPACGAVVPVATPSCSACGFKWPVPKREIVHATIGDRRLVDEAVLLEELRRRPLGELLPKVRHRGDLARIARARGYRPGWVYFMSRDLGLGTDTTGRSQRDAR